MSDLLPDCERLPDVFLSVGDLIGLLCLPYVLGELTGRLTSRGDSDRLSDLLSEALCSCETAECEAGRSAPAVSGCLPEPRLLFLGGGDLTGSGSTIISVSIVSLLSLIRLWI